MKTKEYRMYILFEMDKKDYVPNGNIFSRPSTELSSLKMENSNDI